MLSVPVVHQWLQVVRLQNLCAVGNLTDPKTGTPIRKRLNVRTASFDLRRLLRQRLCSGQRGHRQIAGSTFVQGSSMSLSEYTERYPLKFARQVARTLVHDRSKSILLARDDVGEHPTKRRRLSMKLGPEAIAARFARIDWQTVLQQADREAPRVGTMVCTPGIPV